MDSSSPLQLLFKSKLLIAGILLALLFIGMVIFFLLGQIKNTTNTSRISTTNNNPKDNITPTLIPITKIPLEKREEAQSQADKKYGDLWANIYKQYPWASKLPIQTDTYFVYLDPNSKHLIAKLYPKTSSTAEVDSLKSSITKRLEGMGAVITEITIDWKISNK